jgi:hypothetical protein
VILPLLSQLLQVFGVKWTMTANDLLTVYADGKLEMGDAALSESHSLPAAALAQQQQTGDITVRIRFDANS